MKVGDTFKIMISYFGPYQYGTQIIRKVDIVYINDDGLNDDGSGVEVGMVEITYKNENDPFHSIYSKKEVQELKDNYDNFRKSLTRIK